MCSKISRYTVISSFDGIFELVNLVSSRIIDGWQPIGGVVVRGEVVHQVMVMYED